MKFKLIAVTAALISGHGLWAQHCGFDELKIRWLENVENRERFESDEARILEKILRQNSLKATARTTEDEEVEYVLPVVVHVIHNNGPENITDEHINNAINYINNGFRKAGAFAGAGTFPGANVKIQFCLASRDPNGNPTNGITRHFLPQYASLDKNTEDQPMKSATSWDPLRYINIWVVKEICSEDSCGFPAGYAYLASAHGQTVDGVVNDYRYFGKNFSFGSTTDEQRAVVPIHELGHYFNLFHPFEGGCPNANCLTNGDRVCDTPPDATDFATFPCSIVDNSCSTDNQDPSPNNPYTSDVPDWKSNFMDYQHNQCKVDFSPGQKTRMRAALTEIRHSLLTSEGCIPVTERDGEINAILYPSENGPCVSPVVPVAVLRNYGTANLTSARLRLFVNGVLRDSTTFNGNLFRDQTANVTLPAVALTPGPYSITVSVSHVNGVAAQDGYAGNDSKTVNFVYSPPATSLEENFSSGALPDLWRAEGSAMITNYTGAVNRNWEISPAGTACHGHGVYLNTFGSASGPVTDDLIIRPLQLYSFQTCTLGFDVAYRRAYTNTKYRLQVLASNDCGFTYSTVYDKNSSQLATVTGFQTTAWAPSSCDDWRNEEVVLDAFAGQDLLLVFRAIVEEGDLYGPNLYLDNIRITGTEVVYPGDANNDKKVDVGDYYLTAAAYGRTGPSRSLQGTLWQAYTAPSAWSSTSNFQGTSVNNRFIDANGDGVINLLDLVATVVNRGSTR